jgi:hypothetical protein
MIRTWITLFFGLACVSFWLGFHGIDLAFNMNRNAIDIGLDGTVRTTIEVYQRGLRLIIISFSLFFVSNLLLLGLTEKG